MGRELNVGPCCPEDAGSTLRSPAPEVMSGETLWLFTNQLRGPGPVCCPYKGPLSKTTPRHCSSVVSEMWCGGWGGGAGPGSAQTLSGILGVPQSWAWAAPQSREARLSLSCTGPWLPQGLGGDPFPFQQAVGENMGAITIQVCWPCPYPSPTSPSPRWGQWASQQSSRLCGFCSALQDP